MSGGIINVENGSTLLSIIIYFLTNILITAQNKWIISHLGFAFPWILTAIHITVCGSGASILYHFFYKVTPALAPPSDDNSSNAIPNEQLENREIVEYTLEPINTIQPVVIDNDPETAVLENNIQEFPDLPNNSDFIMHRNSSMSPFTRSLSRLYHLVPKRFVRQQDESDTEKFFLFNWIDLRLALFSILYTMNLAISTLSMRYVSLIMHQIQRCTIPLFTVCIEYIGISKIITHIYI